MTTLLSGSWFIPRGWRANLLSQTLKRMALVTITTESLRLYISHVSGLGFGSFQSVDFAIVMDILPAERDKAKDIAVWHQVSLFGQG